MDRPLKEILGLHLAASLDMLENAMSACPDELWERPSQQMGFWYMAYHALWFLDYDLSLPQDEFRSPAFDIYNYELEVKEPPFQRPYSKKDLSSYLQHCRGRIRAVIDGLEQDTGTHWLRGCKRIDANVTELLIDQIRHIQHHAAQLNLLLRQTNGDAPRWVRRSRNLPGA